MLIFYLVEVHIQIMPWEASLKERIPELCCCSHRPDLPWSSPLLARNQASGEPGQSLSPNIEANTAEPKDKIGALPTSP